MCAVVLYLVLTIYRRSPEDTHCYVLPPPLITFLFEVIVLQGVDFLRQAELCGDTHTHGAGAGNVQKSGENVNIVLYKTDLNSV